MRLPDGRAGGVSGGIGGTGSAGGTAEMLINYNTGEISGFLSGGLQFGWNGGYSASLFSGYVWGIGDSNGNYSGGFTTISGGAGLGGYLASSSSGLSGGIPYPDGKVKAAGVSFGTSMTLVTGGVSATNYTKPLSLGKYWLLANPMDFAFYIAKQLCQ